MLQLWPQGDDILATKITWVVQVRDLKWINQTGIKTLNMSWVWDKEMRNKFPKDCMNAFLISHNSWKRTQN